MLQPSCMLCEESPTNGWLPMAANGRQWPPMGPREPLTVGAWMAPREGSPMRAWFACLLPFHRMELLHDLQVIIMLYMDELFGAFHAKEGI